MNFCYVIVLFVLIYFAKADEVTFDSENSKENKVLTLRTVRDIEENLMYNELKHSNTQSYFDEVSKIYKLKLKLKF
jgi:hypothetical protein